MMKKEKGLPRVAGAFFALELGWGMVTDGSEWERAGGRRSL